MSLSMSPSLESCNAPVPMSLRTDTLPCIIPGTILANKRKVRSGQELVRPVQERCGVCAWRAVSLPMDTLPDTILSARTFSACPPPGSRRPLLLATPPP